MNEHDIYLKNKIDSIIDIVKSKLNVAVYFNEDRAEKNYNLCTYLFKMPYGVSYNITVEQFEDAIMIYDMTNWMIADRIINSLKHEFINELLIKKQEKV